MSITGVQVLRLQNALLKAFPRHADLTQMVRIGIGENLDMIVVPGSLKDVTFNLITWAEAEDRLSELVAKACEANPGNSALQVVAEELGVQIPAKIETATPRSAPTNRTTMIQKKAEILDAAVNSGIVLLHLSDLHFGNKNRFQGLDLADFGQQFSQAVQEALQEQGWGRPVDMVVVSGDIAELAKPKEFEQGHTFLRAVVGGLNLSTSRTIFVPGNHDLSWALCEKVDADRKIYDYDDMEYEKHLHDIKFQFYQEFLQKFYDLPDANLAQLPGRTVLDQASGAYLHDFILDDMPISFAGLNTSEKETHKTHGGELGKPQAQALITAWGAASYARFLKVAIVHHNPLATPSENLQWSEEWFAQQIAAKKLTMTPDELKHYTADMAGFKGSEFLKRVVRDTDTHLVLHGHHHTPTDPTLWPHRGDGVAPILSVGSMGLNADQIPTDQPLTCQLIYFQVKPEPRLIAIPLEFDLNCRLHGTLDKGQFRLNPKSEANYNKPLILPQGWISKQSTDKMVVSSEEKASKLAHFATYYRKHLTGLYSTYDLKNLGVLPTEMHKTKTPQLDDLYLPLRFDEVFDINHTEQGKIFDVATICKITDLLGTNIPLWYDGAVYKIDDIKMQPTMVVGIDLGAGTSDGVMIDFRRHLVITGAAGTGKTTWMRYTFRRMLESEQTFPFLIELRAVAKFWNEQITSRSQRSIEAYLEDWLQETAPAFKDFGILMHDLLDPGLSWLPIILVDGWDELGDLGVEFREKLTGVLKQYPSLIVIASSRPYGVGRPSSSEGFKEYFVQPLSPKEIETLTLNFYTKCYQEEEAIVKKQATAFGQALQRSEDAQLLAKTPLLLTMMLFINRSKRLPDKRHQLYEECLLSLLSERPSIQSDEGVQTITGQWCPKESGRARVQIVARMSHDMQVKHSGPETNSGSITSIIVAKETIKKYLPVEWENFQRDGFLLWLCGRTGVMVDDIQDNIWFAHLSFQEFLTAWYLNYHVLGADAEIRFQELAAEPVWWETLLLWLALLNDYSIERAEQILQSLLDKEYLLLVGMMLADGVGTEVQMQVWCKAFAVLLSIQWPDQIERCLRAWQSSRQEERRESLLGIISKVAGEADWIVWLRLNDAAGKLGGGIRLPINHPSSAQQSPLLTLYPDMAITRQGFAGARTLSGNSALWPTYPVGLLHLWPSERRKLALALQRLSSLGEGKEKIKIYLIQRQTFRGHPLQMRLGKRMHNHGHTLTNSLVAYLGLHLDSYFIRDLSLAFDRDQVHGMSFDLGLTVINDIARFIDLSHIIDFDYIREQGKIYHENSTVAHLFNGGAYFDKNQSLDLFERFMQGTHLLRGLLSLIANLSLDSTFIGQQPINMFMLACLSSVTRGRLQQEKLLSIFDDATKQGIDPLWIALARHIARLSTNKDRVLLEDLAAHPEKREGELSWGLQYLVRGDVLLPDGTEVTLDELCQEAGIPLYPLLEEMPPELEYEEEEEATA